MKALFKVLLFVLPALLFTQCEKGEAVVNPNDPYFTIPDHTFYSALIEDTDGDGLISSSEAKATDSLLIGGGISRSANGSRGWKSTIYHLKIMEELPMNITIH